MLTKLQNLDESLVVVREEERPWGFLVHALGWIPVWGFIFTAAVWLYFKNRSREMIFHVQQVVQFQIVVLVPVITWIICTILTSIVGNLSPAVGGLLQTLNTFLLSVVLTILGCTALIGGGLVYMGKGFLYPVIGRRVLEATIRKFTEE